MKKKVRMRIQAFVLILLLIFTTLVVSPEQVQADTEVASDEDMISADEEVTPDVSGTEDKKDLEQTSNEAESETGTDITDKSEEKTADSADVEVTVSDSAERSVGIRAYTNPAFFTYQIINGTITITGYNALFGPKDVNIPPTIENCYVTCIGENAFDNCNLKSVTIPDTVMFIRQSAFKNNMLTSVTIPDSVIRIEKHAFSCNLLNSITIENGVRLIDYQSFYDNELTSVTIPDSVEHIGWGAFQDNAMGYSSEVSIPDSIQDITNEDDSIMYSNPSRVRIAACCFDTLFPFTGKHYIEADYSIKESPFDDNIIEKLWRPLYVTGTIVEFWNDELMITDYFLEFTYNGRTAYVLVDAVKQKNPPMTGYAKQTLYMRDVPGGSIIGTIPIGRKVSGNLFGNMVKTTYNGMTGYVYASLLQKNPVKITRYVKANAIIRSTPNGSIITRLWRPIRVTGTIRGAWLKFTYGGKPAYVAMSATTTRNPPMSGYAKQTLNLRNTPTGSIIGKIPIGRKVSGVLVGNMVKTTYNGKAGYVYATLLQKNPVKVTRYIKAKAIIRSTPNGSIITRLWRPIRVTGTIQGAWLKFTYNGKTAYVAMSATTTRNPPMTGYAKQSLNLRNTPTGSIIGTIPRGVRVSGVLVRNMIKTTYNGKTGYVYATLLQKNPVK